MTPLAQLVTAKIHVNLTDTMRLVTSFRSDRFVLKSDQFIKNIYYKSCPLLTSFLSTIGPETRGSREAIREIEIFICMIEKPFSYKKKSLKVKAPPTFFKGNFDFFFATFSKAASF